MNYPASPTNLSELLIIALIFVHLICTPLFFNKSLNFPKFLLAYIPFTGGAIYFVWLSFFAGVATTGDSLGNIVIIFPLGFLLSVAAIAILVRTSLHLSRLSNLRVSQTAHQMAGTTIMGGPLDLPLLQEPTLIEQMDERALHTEAKFEVLGVFLSSWLLSSMMAPLIFSIPPITVALGYVTYPVPDVQDWVYYPILVGLIALGMAEIVWRVWTSVISRQEAILSARPPKIHRAILTSVLIIPAFMYAHNKLDNPLDIWVVLILCLVHLFGTRFFFNRALDYIRFLAVYTSFTSAIVVGISSFGDFGRSTLNQISDTKDASDATIALICVLVWALTAYLQRTRQHRREPSRSGA